MNDSICFYFDDNNIDEFDCDLMCNPDCCIADDCTYCSYFKDCSNCKNEPYCHIRHNTLDFGIKSQA